MSGPDINPHVAASCRNHDARIVLATTTSVDVRLSNSLRLNGVSDKRANDAMAMIITNKLAQSLREAGRDPAIFQVGRQQDAMVGDVLIVIQAGPSQTGKGYALCLSVEQDANTWRRSLIRPSGVSPAYVGITDESGRPSGVPMFESVLLDLEQLADELNKTVDIEDSL